MSLNYRERERDKH